MRRKKKAYVLPQIADSVSTSRKFVLTGPNDEQRDPFAIAALHTQSRSFSMLSNRAFAAVLFGLFIVVLLIAFLVGINVYRVLDNMAVEEGTQRLEESFLANTVHSNDLYDTVRIGEGPEGDALVLLETVDGDSSYETRIYAYDGSIVQEYAFEGAPYVPEKAITLFESKHFDFELGDSLLTIHTDSGSVNIAVRSAGELSR